MKSSGEIRNQSDTPAAFVFVLFLLFPQMLRLPKSLAESDKMLTFATRMSVLWFGEKCVGICSLSRFYSVTCLYLYFW